MNHLACLNAFVLVVLSGLVGTGSASAQSVVYAGGTIFADVRDFGGVGSEGLFGSENLPSLDATGVGGSFRVGTWLHPRWSLELGLDLATTTKNDYDSDAIIAIYPPPFPLTLTASSDFTTVTVMVGFHQPVSKRLQMGYRGGFAFVRATSTVEFVPLDPRILAAFDLQAPAVSQTTNSGAVALGVEAAITLTPHLAIVPEVRALVPGNPSGLFLIRPGLGARWTF